MYGVLLLPFPLMHMQDLAHDIIDDQKVNSPFHTTVYRRNLIGFSQSGTEVLLSRPLLLSTVHMKMIILVATAFCIASIPGRLKYVF